MIMRSSPEAIQGGCLAFDFANTSLNSTKYFIDNLAKMPFLDIVYDKYYIIKIIKHKIYEKNITLYYKKNVTSRDILQPLVCVFLLELTKQNQLLLLFGHR